MRSWVVALNPAYVLIVISSLLCFVSFEALESVELASKQLKPVSLESRDDSEADETAER